MSTVRADREGEVGVGRSGDGVVWGRGRYGPGERRVKSGVSSRPSDRDLRVADEDRPSFGEYSRNKEIRVHFTLLVGLSHL